ncbi:MAG: ASKHA domain-containing protein [Leptospirales bacterium]|nr:ASKHA domain-containing protein [Leptospirales bacterium]
MAKLTVFPAERTMTVPQGLTVINALDEMGIAIDSPCGGRGICGKCLVKAGASSGLPAEVLACRCVIEDDLVLELPAKNTAKINIAPSIENETRFAFAVDIGTTSVEISMLGLDSGKSVAQASFMNPQRRYGYDVISRIAATKNSSSRAQMTDSIRLSIMDTIDAILKKTGVPRKAVERAALSGNTVMTYLFAGLDVAPLGVYPYKLEYTDFEEIPAPQAGLDLPKASIFLAPPASAFIGGDITGALALINYMDVKEGLFFADIGTNGEMFLKDGNSILAVSCAMGPALEGMNISMGMTASEGAVAHAALHAGVILVETIGGGAPTGFAGTGIIDIVSLLLKSGLIRKDGAFNNAALNFSNAGFAANGFTIGDNLALSQNDVRAIQLAKAACLSGALILLREAALTPDEIGLLIIAGSLGANLNIANFKTLGFLPSFSKAKNLITGNTSLAAAARSCLDPSFRAEIKRLKNMIRVIEPAAVPDFDEIFLRSSEF